MADITNPFGNKKPLASSLLPSFYQTDPNKSESLNEVKRQKYLGP